MSKTRILIVDADPNLSRLAGMILQGSGLYDVMILDHADRALPAAVKFRPDLMLLGVDMPDKSGGDTAAAAFVSRLRNIPVIFLTDLGSQEAGSKQLDSSGKRFLAKPVEPAVLLDAVAGLICGPVFR